MARKSERPKAGQESLTRERILDAALSIVHEAGVDGLTMRRLAGDLGVDPMAIYNHLPNKQAVINGVVERVFATLEVPAVGENQPWQVQVRAFAEAYRSLARMHSKLVFYLVTDVEGGARAALGANERLYAPLEQAGLPPRLIVRAADLIIDFLNGYALGEQSGDVAQPGYRGVFVAHLAGQPPEQYPTLRRVYAALTDDDLRASFEAELDLLLEGIGRVAGST